MTTVAQFGIVNRPLWLGGSSERGAKYAISRSRMSFHPRLPSASIQLLTLETSAELVAEINAAVHAEKRAHEYNTFLTFDVLSRIEQAVILTSQPEIAEFIANTAFPTLAVRMRKWFHENSFDEGADDRLNPDHKTRIELFNQLVSSFCLVSARFAQTLMEADYLFVLLKSLTSPRIMKEFEVIGSYHGCQSRSDIRLVYQWAKTSKKREIKYKTRLIDALEPYAEATDDDVKMVTVLTIGLLAAEKNRNLIHRCRVVRQLAHWLQTALKNREHRFNGFSALDIAEPLRRLSVHEECKAKIVRAEVLPLLLKMLLNAFDQDEQTVACEIIWQLAFDKEVRKTVRQNKDLVSQLDRLARTGDSWLNWSARGALNAVNGHKEKEAAARLQPKHIRIICSKDDSQAKKKVKELKDCLTKNCYSVTVVDDSIESQRRKASASTASVNLILVSENLKQSPGCRQDAEMTRDSKSSTLFLTIQDYYEPDGWLRSLTGGNYYFEFTEKKSIDDIDDPMLHHLEKMVKTSTR